MGKFLSGIILLYFLALLQISFLPVFWFETGLFLNLSLIFIIIFNFLEKSSSGAGLLLAAVAGFFLDVFSSSFFGFWTLIFLGAAFLVKYGLKRYIYL